MVTLEYLRGVLKSSIMESGAPFAMTAGVSMTPVLSAGNWVMLEQYPLLTMEHLALAVEWLAVIHTGEGWEVG